MVWILRKASMRTQVTHHWIQAFKLYTNMYSVQHEMWGVSSLFFLSLPLCVTELLGWLCAACVVSTRHFMIKRPPPATIKNKRKKYIVAVDNFERVAVCFSSPIFVVHDWLNVDTHFSPPNFFLVAVSCELCESVKCQLPQHKAENSFPFRENSTVSLFRTLTRSYAVQSTSGKSTWVLSKIE